MFNVFEQPWGLLCVAVTVFFVVFVLRFVVVRRCFLWFWLMPFFLAIAAFGLDFLVKTDEESIREVVKSGSKAVEQENADAIDAIIADNYSDSVHYDKTHLMRHCRIRLSVPFVQKNITRFVSIDITGPEATAVFTVRMIFDPDSYLHDSYKGQVILKIQADLQKQNDRWLITSVELLTLDMRPASWYDIQQSNY